MRHSRQHGERPVRIRRGLRLGDVLREHHSDPVRPAGAGGVGSGQEVAVHLARPVRKERHIPAVPRGHVGCGEGGFRRGQRGMLDADSGRWRGNWIS